MAKTISKRDIENRISLKVIAWVSIIVGSLGLYANFFSILQFEIWLSTPLFYESTSQKFDFSRFGFQQELNLKLGVRMFTYFLSLISLLIMISGIGLLKLQNWGRILFSTVSIIALVVIVGGILFFTLNIQDFFYSEVAGGLLLIDKVIYLSYEVLLVALTWALIKTTIMINKRELKIHFDDKMGW